MRQLLTLFLCLFLAGTIDAKSANVRAVMFFSPTCSHCHQVLEETLPPLMERYRGQFELILINISTKQGSQLYYTAATLYQISESNWGVPALLLGNAHLIGSKEISSELPRLIEEGLSSGGVPFPKLPGLIQALRTEGSGVFILHHPSDLNALPQVGLADKLAKDPIGSALAVFLLMGLVGSLIFFPFRWVQFGLPQGAGVRGVRWLFPALLFFGLLISCYLTYLEVTGHAAFCGPIGNCDEVQQSAYAWLFGVIPIGLVGVLGYIALGVAWGLRQFSSFRLSFVALPILTYLAVIVSAYLTFLEPFVIGAICTWCLISAAITLALLWLNFPSLYTNRLKN